MQTSKVKLDPAPKEILMKQVKIWLDKVDTPDWKDFRLKKLVWTLADELERKAGLVTEPPNEVQLPQHLLKPRKLVSAFIELYGTYYSLKQVEFYFRRYPFRGLPVSRNDHFQNICEMYFNGIYKVHQRIKQCIRALKEACPEQKISEDAVSRPFYETFRIEIEKRNTIHHQESFQDRDIDELYLTGLTRHSQREHLISYRRLSKRWAQITRQQLQRVDNYVDLTARLILLFAEFLKE